MEVSLFEGLCVTAFFCWLFFERVVVMVDVLSARVQRTACAVFGGEPAGEAELRRAVQRRRRDLIRKRDSNDNELLRREIHYKQHRIELLLNMKEKPMKAPLPTDARANNLSLGSACERCTPGSREAWVNGRHSRNRVINVMDLGRDTASGFFSRRFCYILQAYGMQKWEQPPITDAIFLDERLHQAIEQTTQEEVSRLKEEKKQKSYSIVSVRKIVEGRAQKIFANWKPMINDILVRLTSWLLHHLMPRILPGGAAVRAEAIARLRAVGQNSNVPLILVPLHRSHLDYIFLTLVLVNCDVRPPLVAAGENLNIPLFGWLMRGLGAFYIRRRVDGANNQRDHIYRALLKAYLLQCLQANYNIEFFIEGTRTRSGKPQMPRGGILSVIVDSYIEGAIEDAMLVPVSMNYEKLVDGNFTREQLGMPKKNENFWTAIKAIWQTLNSNYGSLRIDFNQPFSLRELVRSFQQENYHRLHVDGAIERPLNGEQQGVSLQQLTHRRQISSTQSCSSLLGDEMSEDSIGLVEAIARHVVYDATKSQAIMSTNVVSWCLLTQFRLGCSLDELVAAVQKLSGRLLSEGRDLGFTGETVDVVNHAVDLLGPGLIKRERESNLVRIQPINMVPNIIELCYYSSSILPHYALQAIVATAAEVLSKSSRTFSQSSLIAESLCLCEVMSQEFLLCPPCRRLNDCVIDTIEELVQKDLIQSLDIQSRSGKGWGWRTGFELDEDDDDIAPSYVDKVYVLVDAQESQQERRYLHTSLQPLIEAYATTSYWLTHSDLIRESGDGPNPVTEREFIKTIIHEMTTAVDQGRLPYGDALSTEAINNCLRLHKLWGVVDLTGPRNGGRVISLNGSYRSRQRLQSIHGLISKFRLGRDSAPTV